MHMPPCSHRTHAAVPDPRVVIDAGLSGLRRLLTDCDAIYCITVLQVRAVVPPPSPGQTKPETEICESWSPRHRSSHYCLIKSLGVSSHMQMQEPSNRGRRCRQDRLYTQHVYLAVRVIGLRFAGHTSPRASSHTHAYSSHDLAAISQSLTIFHLHISCSPSQWQSLLRPP
jgi:hypothetical protein